LPRFFVDISNIRGNQIILNDEDLSHIKVLRIRDGETFFVCDGCGTDYLCSLKGSCAAILESFPSQSEPNVKCAVFAAFPKSDKAETIIQKSVELGAYEIVFFPSSRCVSRPDTAKKLYRWQKISEAAAKQSARGIVPSVTAAASYESAIAAAAANDLPLFLYEGEETLKLSQALDYGKKYETASIVTGPEGGFSAEEAEFARQNGMSVITLGKRILRCETAPLAAISAVMFHTGNL